MAKERPLTDVELVALGLLALCETISRADENEARRADGMANAHPAAMGGPFSVALEEALEARRKR